MVLYYSCIMGSRLFILVSFLCLFQDVILGEEADALSYIPKWENLECEVGHKYMFSDETHTWNEAIAECQLYGGWFNPRITCGGDNYNSLAGDAMLMSISTNKHFNGAWCDYPSSNLRNF